MTAAIRDIAISKRILALVMAGALAVFLALVWDRMVNTPAVIGFQAGLLEGIRTAGPGVALGLSFLVGVSMIFVPCTFPMVYTLAPIAEEAKTRRGWVATIALFSLGLTAAMALVGVIISLVGQRLLTLFSTEQARLGLTLFLYSAIGIFALIYALGELGFLSLPSLPMAEMPRWARGMGRYPRSLTLGLVVGGGLGVGCPAPTYYTVLLFAATVGNPLFGAALLGVNALGRVAPIALIGTLFFAGTSPRRISGWITERRAVIKMVNGVALTLLGGFLLAYWTLGVGLGIL